MNDKSDNNNNQLQNKSLFVEPILKDLIIKITNCCNYLDNPQYSLFKGCYDWHSCVHGFWAIFRISLFLQLAISEQHQALHLYDIINDDSVRGEFSLISQNPDFEFPYGRAWILRLSIDYHIWCVNHNKEPNKSFKEMTDFVAKDLLERVITDKKEEVLYSEDEYGNIPWTCIQLFEYNKYFNSDEKAEEVSIFVEKNFLKKVEITFKSDLNSEGFFSLSGLLILCINKTLSVEKRKEFLKLNPDFLDNLDVVDIGGKVHQLGLNWSRAWGLKSCVKEENFWEHVKVGMDVHNLIQKEKKFGEYSSYYAYDHWVPQFIVYALTY